MTDKTNNESYNFVSKILVESYYSIDASSREEAIEKYKNFKNSKQNYPEYIEKELFEIIHEYAYGYTADYNDIILVNGEIEAIPYGDRKVGDIKVIYKESNQ